MKKVSIISPVYQDVQNLSKKISEISEFFAEKYDYQVLCYYYGQLPGSLTRDSHFVYYRIEDGQTYDDCVRDAFSRVDGDAVIVADINNDHYIEFIHKLLMEWEKNAEVVLVKKEQKKLNIFQKIGKFFVELFHKMQDFVLSFFGLAKDVRAMRTFQLFDKNTTDFIKQFPEKNFYLRNFDCWKDYNVAMLSSKEDIKIKKNGKVWTKDLILAISSFGVSAVLILVLALTAGLIAKNGRAMFVLIGIALIVVSLLFGARNFLVWFVSQKAKISKEKIKKPAEQKTEENVEDGTSKKSGNANNISRPQMIKPIKKINKRKVTIQKK